MLYNDSGSPIGVLPNAKEIKRTQSTSGTDTLEFQYPIYSYFGTNEEILDDMSSQIHCQYFIETEDQKYVIKKVNPQNGILYVTATVYLDELTNTTNLAFSRPDEYLGVLVTNALNGTGWGHYSSINTEKRSLAMKTSTALDIVKKVAELFMTDLRFDAKNKIVYLNRDVSENKGVFFDDKINLISLNLTEDTEDLVTRLIPIGKDNLDITEVNDGLSYVENHQYTAQDITAYWSSDQYTNAEDLKEDAIRKLSILSQPKITFDVNVLDLARIAEVNRWADKYDELEYGLGDTITIMDRRNQIRRTARIVQMVTYPENPNKNTLQLDSEYTLMEDYFDRITKVDEQLSDITTATGEVNGDKIDGVSGDKVDSIDWTKVQNVQIVTAQIGDAQITNAKIKDAEITTAKIGDAQITAAKIKDAEITTAKIQDASITDAKIVSLTADKITAGTIDAQYIHVINLNADWINAGTINANLIGARTITADKIAANSITATEMKAGTITADSGIIADAAIGNAQIQNLAVTGAKIATATIDTANIKNGAITTALIETGAVNTAQIADGSITDAKIVSLTASKITAGTLDAGVINVVNLNADNITVGTINGQRITDGTIGGTKIENGAIDDSKIQDGASINGSKLNINTVFDEMNANQDIGYGDGGYGESAYGGERHELNDNKIIITQEGKTLDLVLANVGDRITAAEIKITPDAIISTVINSGEFGTASSQIAQSADNVKIGFNGIDSNVVFDAAGLHINHGSIDASLANITNINASNINTGLLQGNLIAANTITGDKLVTDAITSREIASKTITANEIASNTITAAQMKTGTITAASGVIGSIDASVITTGTLDASKINVTNLVAHQLQVTQTNSEVVTIDAQDRAFVDNNIWCRYGQIDKQHNNITSYTDWVTYDDGTQVTLTDSNGWDWIKDTSTTKAFGAGTGKYPFFIFRFDLKSEYERIHGGVLDSTGIQALANAIDNISYKWAAKATDVDLNTLSLNIGIWNPNYERNFSGFSIASSDSTTIRTETVTQDVNPQDYQYIKNVLSSDGYIYLYVMCDSEESRIEVNVLQFTVHLKTYSDTIVAYGTTLVDAMPDINGGRIYVYNNSGDKNVTIGSSGFAASNRGGTLILHDNDESHKVEAGISSQYDAGLINVYGSSTDYAATLYANNQGQGPTVYLKNGTDYSALTSSDLYVERNQIVSNGHLYHIGRGSAAYTTSVSLDSNDTITITHSLGYYPIVQFDGNTGNRILTVAHSSTSQLTISNYSSGGNTWAGTVRLY
jgi:phage minor structural protein